MNRVPIADYAASSRWSGISGKPAFLDSVLTLNRAQPGYIYWNGSTLSTTSIVGLSSGTTVGGNTEPASAVRRKPPGNSSGPFENVWARYQCNVREFGATGSGVSDDTQALNAAIASVNMAGGGAIYVPTGRYSVTFLDLIQVPCLVYGDGVGNSIIRCNTGDGLAFYGPHLAGICRLSIENTYIGVSAEGSELQMDQCSIGASHRCLLMDGVIGGGVTNSYFTSLGTSTVAIYGTVDDVSFGSLRCLVGTSWEYGMYISVGTGITVDDLYVNGVSHSVIYLGTGVFNSRMTNVAGAYVLGTSMVEDHGTNNFVDGLFGLGGNTDSRWDARKELFRRFTWVPGNIPTGYGFYEDFTLEGATMGDQVVLGIDGDAGPATITQGRIIATDQCRISVINIGTSDIYIGTSQCSFRAYN